jgi:hypothetical protein
MSLCLRPSSEGAVGQGWKRGPGQAAPSGSRQSFPLQATSLLIVARPLLAKWVGLPQAMELCCSPPLQVTAVNYSPCHSPLQRRSPSLSPSALSLWRRSCGSAPERFAAKTVKAVTPAGRGHRWGRTAQAISSDAKRRKWRRHSIGLSWNSQSPVHPGR